MISINGTIKKSNVFLIDFFTKGNARTVQIKKNVAASILMRVTGMLIGFIQIPITLRYLNPTRYGIWVTIGSFIVLFNFIDIGLSNGLRNKFAESLAKNNKTLAQTYVSLTYLLITGIVIVFYFIFHIIHPHINWAGIFNAPAELKDTIDWLVIIVFTSFAVTFILQIIRTIYIADQKPALADFIKLCCSIFTLSAIIILSETTDGSLIYIALAFGAAPVVVYITATIISFSNKYKEYLPSFKTVDLRYTKNLTNLGMKFFVIQVSALILFSSDSIIITQILGPAAVTPYSISFKYFSSVMVIYTLIVTPYWSGFTDAYHKNDEAWIKQSITSLRKIGITLSFVILLMIFISGTVYNIWIGDSVDIPFSLSWFMGINMIILVIATPYVNFINGVGIITLQLIVGLSEAIINIPLSIYFAKHLALGATGVIMATCTINVIALILWPLQYNKIINKRAKGIWAK